MKDIRRFDVINKSINKPNCTVCQETPEGIPWVQFSTCNVFSCAPYVPCKDLEERYGPIEYHPKYEGISPEAKLARREPFWTDQKRANEGYGKGNDSFVRMSPNNNIEQQKHRSQTVRQDRCL